MAKFTAQFGEVSKNDMLKLRIFSSSLIGPAFTWYVSLPLGSIQAWQDMEKAFHNQFYQADPEVTLVDLTKVNQKSARDICKTRLPDNEYVRLAIDNLRPMLRMHFIGK